MAERPRLTGSLRAFSGVGIPIAYSTADELRDELAEKRRRRNESKSITWRDLRKIVDETCPSKDKRNVSVGYDELSIFFSFSFDFSLPFYARLHPNPIQF